MTQHTRSIVSEPASKKLPESQRVSFGFGSEYTLILEGMQEW